MALTTCPDCQKQISDQAPACIHCGCPISTTDVPTEKDSSNLKCFRTYLIDNNKVQYQTIWAKNLPDAENKISQEFKGFTINEKYGIQELPVAAGKFNCPSCKSKYTFCQKNIGCAIMIIIFISLGLGLIMIPFLPRHCECRVCDYKWKS